MLAGAAPTWRPRLGELWRPLLLSGALVVLLRGSVMEPFLVPSGSMAPTLLAGDRLLVSRLAYGLSWPFTSVRLLGRSAPRRGDVVVFRDPRDDRRLLVRRVVGLPGDVIELREQILLVSGVPQPHLAEGEASHLDRDGAGGWRSDRCRLYREILPIGPIGPTGGDGAAVAAAWARAASPGVASHGVLQCRRVRPGRGEGPFEPVRPGHVFVLADNRDRAEDGRAGGWQVPEERVLGRAELIWWSASPEPAAEAGRGVRMDRLFKLVE